MRSQTSDDGSKTSNVVSQDDEVAISMRAAISRKRYVIVGVALALTLAACGSGVSASDVAVSAGASSCTSSGFGLVLRVSGDKQTIYNCFFDPGGEKCVTYENGIANDATEEVRLVFASTLGSGKPTCLG